MSKSQIGSYYVHGLVSQCMWWDDVIDLFWSANSSDECPAQRPDTLAVDVFDVELIISNLRTFLVKVKTNLKVAEWHMRSKKYTPHCLWSSHVPWTIQYVKFSGSFITSGVLLWGFSFCPDCVHGCECQCACLCVMPEEQAQFQERL